jgi:hypothetical protein
MAERIIAATYRVSSILVRHEHAQWTTAVLDLVDALGSPLDPMMAGAGAWWLHAQGRIAESQALALAGLAAAPSPIDASTERCWFALCLPERDPDELARRVTHWDAASAASSDPFARYTFAWCLAISSTRSWAQHDDRCQPWIEQSIALLEAAVTTTNNPAPRIWLAHARGIAARESGDVRQALDNYGRVVELSRVAEHHAMEAMAALFIAGALRAIEVIDPVAYSEAIEITHRHRVYCELTIGYLATHLLRRGHRRAGAMLHGYVNASGSRVPPAVTWPSLGDDPDLAAWSHAGAAMTLDEAVGCALAALADLTPPVDRPHMDTTG